MKAAALLLLTLIPCSAAPAPYLHVDAAAQRELRNMAALPPLSQGQAVDIALALRPDGSPATLQSAIVAQRPVFRTDGANAFLRFDGENDFLALAGPRKLSPAATVFILAAPKTNPGYFRGFFALSEFGKNDYTAGLNLDLGPNATNSLSFLNLESAGAQGARDLLQAGKNLAADLPFGGFHLFTVRSEIKPAGGEAWIDGLPLAKRDRLESNIGFDQFVLGARYYSNDPAQQPFIGSFFHGDIAEVMVFDSALSEQDRKDIEDKLLAKLPALNALASGKSGHSLETVKDAPPVQMLVPGFSVSELPLKLTNRNNLRYRHDGKLVALGYDGTIHLLTDTDGDGMEDKAEVFWDRPTMRGPLGIALLPKDDPRGDGVIVPSKGKVSLILDRDRDGRADEEIIVATGWQEISQNVDAVGVAVDPKDGSIYFGLGTANYTNAYLIDPATGKAAYDIKSERGTIQKVSPDFKTRTTVCTGIRFTCALGFNREGDLFATEQEGATWLPNGNPLDELLHIQPGKHYGFPPRHPKHLPDVLDWPAVVEYGPQHQSTVGMCFNESVNGGPTFGPDFWACDAIVCGEARGKLYRTKLVKTPHGYVGQNHLIACLSLLTVDACVSPAGDLLVACHSGPANAEAPVLPGNWLAGRRVFFSSEAACFTCHQIRGEGIAVGPDLSNLIFRDHDSVVADILQPSATINPDHPASTVKLKSGATLTGIVRHANDKELKVALQAGAVQTLAAADVASTELLKTSLMPEGYAERLTLEQQQDLIKFLLQNPLEPAPVERAEPAPPPARKRAEVEGVLNRAYRSDRPYTTYPPLKILLAVGPKDHGPGEHDYPLWQKRWSTLLALAPGVTVDTSWEFPKPEQLAAADVTVFYSKNPGFNPRTAMLLDDYQNRGGGLVYLHWALNGDEHADILAERIGLAGGRTGVAYRHGEFDLVFPQPEHPVTKGFPTLHFTDETYWRLVGDPARINLLGTGVEEGTPQPQLWSIERGKGRVIGCVPGHYTWTFDDPLYRALVLRAICWTAKQEDVDRLAELATVGARIAN